MPHVAVLMDPLETLSLKKDSTLAMLRAAQLRGWEVSYLQQGDLYLEAGTVRGALRRVRLRDDFAATLDPAVAGEDWYELADVTTSDFSDVDVVLMRKDPPFDMEYIYSTYLLERLERAGVHVLNRPQSLRDCNEKLFATEFPQCCPPLLVSRDMQRLRDFHAEHEDVIYKRLDGMGGMSIFRAQPGDPNLSVILETLTVRGSQQIMAQRYLPEIVDGDKRILLIDGEPVPYALARVPLAGESRGNLAAGGTGRGQPLSDRDRWITEQIGPELRRRGLLFVGIDVIGDYLTEINVTCPTCIRELDQQFGLDIAGKLFDRIDSLLTT
ncbi:MAG: glutathione synthase [Pseudomonadota bacterium]